MQEATFPRAPVLSPLHDAAAQYVNSLCWQVVCTTGGQHLQGSRRHKHRQAGERWVSVGAPHVKVPGVALCRANQICAMLCRNNA